MERGTIHLEAWVREGLTAQRMLELAHADPEQPYPGGHSVWRAYVRRVRQEVAHDQAVADVPIRFEGMPGLPQSR